MRHTHYPQGLLMSPPGGLEYLKMPMQAMQLGPNGELIPTGMQTHHHGSVATGESSLTSSSTCIMQPYSVQASLDQYVKSFLRPDNSPRGNGCTGLLEILHEHTLLSFLLGHFGVFQFMAPNRNYWGVGGLVRGGEKCEKNFFQYFKFFEWNMLNFCLNE